MLIHTTTTTTTTTTTAGWSTQEDTHHEREIYQLIAFFGNWDGMISTTRIQGLCWPRRHHLLRQ